ncbi:Bax protein [Luminiphilus syltensis NOR5-1B]|uniref:Bax protein n=2 Tax=Luminiphilus TaxID=1341118 RepID=B8KVC1_9GAMM|nr:Bax protein [Luminiphilus syltensis NOR5-1B]
MWPSAPAFSDFEAGPERKHAFISYIQPLVDQTNAEILEDRRRLVDIYEHKDDLGLMERHFLSGLVDYYDLADFDETNDTHWQTLLQRVDQIPPSLAIAQAAKESGWGTSRFAREGNNYFGQWCFEPGCGLVPRDRKSGKAHEVADFSSPAESVEAYIANLNRHPAYETLRTIRASASTRGTPATGSALAAGLERYSSRGEQYVREIQAMIRNNDLERFDQDDNR